jgi:arsenite oxidase large subunit
LALIQMPEWRLAPKDAKVQTVVCHYCIVGCGYKAISWPVDREGGTAPDQNVFGVDLSKQQAADSDAWYSPAMYNVVKQDGQDVHMVIKPDYGCEVNSGLASIRGSRIAEMSFSAKRNTQEQRLTDPLVWRYSGLYPTSWDDAIGLVAEVTRRVIEEQGEDGLLVSAFDHGGAGGGYENTWATGKLYFDSMKVKNIRIHNRPAYNSEVHATRDMGIGELNNCYEDAELADTIFAVGTNALETQTNYFLNHWIPNLRGESMKKKKKELADEPHPKARIVIVDPRRTVTVNACEVEAGKDNVLHLQINSGTDLMLFNALMTEIATKGWIDKDFIAASTAGFDDMVAANKVSADEAAKVTGLTPDQITKAAAWIAEPKEGGKRRRTMFCYEKGLIWGNDNYRTNGALVNIALATGNIGRPGGGCVRMGGHQEGYVRPSDAFIGRPAPYVDQLLINNKGGVHHIWACDNFKTTLNAQQYRNAYKRRTDLVKYAKADVPYGDRNRLVDAVMGAIRQGGLFSVDVDIIPTKASECAHVVLQEQRLKILADLNAENQKTLTHYHWVDKDKGIVGIPIDLAIRLTLLDLQAKKPHAAGPVVMPSPASSTPAPGSLPSRAEAQSSNASKPHAAGPIATPSATNNTPSQASSPTPGQGHGSGVTPAQTPQLAASLQPGDPDAGKVIFLQSLDRS